MKLLDYLTTSQIGTLHHLGGQRNARRVIESMSDYLGCFRDRENVYYLNKAGREYIGSDTVRQKLAEVDHYLMRNDLYIKRRPESFDTEQRIKTGEITIVCDAIMQCNSTRYLVEIDNTQSMTKNVQKIEKYKKLKDLGVFQKQFGYFPRIFWVCTSEARRKNLTDACVGLETVIHTWDEIK
ncbi:replication-relaxation family protein [Paenibacillus sp. Soil724D2]|uniref:replication-relaxation family protein n=1 Tax=Paenibacillus sp. (strain Soil724D2) TaxID=1736392 RepID=UPI00138F886F|nr:replication-relaxation family protein [Paenibacillus sp. Soil724D2]